MKLNVSPKYFYPAAGVCTVVCIVLIAVNASRIKQSIKGIMGQSFFTIDELCKSKTADKYGIDNTPNETVKVNLQALIDNVLDPVRLLYGSYIQVTSGYRSAKLNAKTGGVSTSQHTTGQAADITGGSVANNRLIFRKIVENGVYDQLIWEKGGQWIHVSYKAGSNRLAILNYENGSYTNINNTWQSVVLA